MRVAKPQSVARTALALALLLGGCTMSVSGDDGGMDHDDGGGVPIEEPDAGGDPVEGPEFPDATVTGWTPPAGHPVVTQNFVVREPGTVVEELDLVGCLFIEPGATHVTVRKVRIRRPPSGCEGALLVVGPPALNSPVPAVAASVLIEDVEVDGGYIQLQHSEAVIRRVNVHHGVAGIWVAGGDQVVIEDSYLHDPVPCAAGDTGLGTQLYVGNVGIVAVARGNRFDRGPGDACTRSYAATLGGLSSTSIRFEHNLLSGGNHVCLRLLKDLNGYQILDNHFATAPFTGCGALGPGVIAPSASGNAPAWIDNVWHESGESLPMPPTYVDPPPA